MTLNFTFTDSSDIQNSYIGVCPKQNSEFDKIVITSDYKFSGKISALIHDESQSEDFTEDNWISSNDKWVYTFIVPEMTYKLTHEEIPELKNPENEKNVRYCNTSMIHLKRKTDLPKKVNVEIDCYLIPI